MGELQRALQRHTGVPSMHGGGGGLALPPLVDMQGEVERMSARKEERQKASVQKLPGIGKGRSWQPQQPFLRAFRQSRPGDATDGIPPAKADSLPYVRLRREAHLKQLHDTFEARLARKRAQEAEHRMRTHKEQRELFALQQARAVQKCENVTGGLRGVVAEEAFKLTPRGKLPEAHPFTVTARRELERDVTQVTSQESVVELERKRLTQQEQEEVEEAMYGLDRFDYAAEKGTMRRRSSVSISGKAAIAMLRMGAFAA